MNNLYEKQALDEYLNDGITHGKKISYGSLGRTKNEMLIQPVNLKRQPLMLHDNKKHTKIVNKNNANLKQNVIELLHKIKTYRYTQKHLFLQKLTRDESNLWNNLGITLSDIDRYLAENTDSMDDCQTNKSDNFEIPNKIDQIN